MRLEAEVVDEEINIDMRSLSLQRERTVPS